MVAMIFALAAMGGWAVGDILNTLSSREMGNKNAYFWWLVSAIIVSSLYIPFAGPIRDPLTKPQGVGIVFSLSGIVLMSLTS